MKLFISVVRFASVFVEVWYCDSQSVIALGLTVFVFEYYKSFWLGHFTNEETYLFCNTTLISNSKKKTDASSSACDPCIDSGKSNLEAINAYNERILTI